MKKILIISLLNAIVYFSLAQNISFKSNGHVNNFKKIDTLFFCEYKGQKPSTKPASFDSLFDNQLMQFDSSFGFTARSISEFQKKEKALKSYNRHFFTTFYAYPDGTLQAPTSTVYFQLNSKITVVNNFSKIGRMVKHNFSKGYYLYLNTEIYDNGDKVFSLCDSLYNEGLVSVIEPVFIRQLKLHSDPLFPNEWNITNTGQYNGTAGADMKVANVWAKGYTGSGIKVAVIDLGVDLNHPDLQGNLLPGYDATGNNSGGGVQYDAFNSHGTNCAGIIAEVQNNIGGIGVSYNAKIIPIRLGIGYLNNHGDISFTATDAQAVNCLNFAVNNGADIISNSWSWGGSSSAQIDAAITNAITNGRGSKGSLVLFSTGNDNSAVLYPATNPNVIAVGASSPCDTRKTPVSCDGEPVWGGNFGTGLDLMAPGVRITTTTLPNGNDYSNAYTSIYNGTSAACPNAAAVLALILSVNPNLTGQQARQILESTCDKVGGYVYQSNVSGQPNGTWSNDAGYGRVNANTAICNAIATLSFSITGPNNAICGTSSATYTVNAPGSAVSWSAYPNGIVSLSPSGNSVTLTRIIDGRVTLTANVGSGSGCNGQSVTKQIGTGLPDISQKFPRQNPRVTGVPIQYTNYNSITQYVIQTNPKPGSSQTWSVTTDDPNLQWGFTGTNNTLGFIFSGNGYTATFYGTETNSCGIDYGYIYCKSVASGGAGGGTPLDASSNLFTISPNPTTGLLNVQTANNYTFGTIRIFDKMGNPVKQFTYPDNTSSATIDISDLPADTYGISVLIGANWASKLFIKN